jgi:hypothetical protein
MEKSLKKIVNEVIRKDCRKEAMEILSLSPQNGVDEFIKYYEDDDFNICCMHLDFLKYQLIKEGKMTKGGHFGQPYTNDDYEENK